MKVAPARYATPLPLKCYSLVFRFTKPAYTSATTVLYGVFIVLCIPKHAHFESGAMSQAVSFWLLNRALGSIQGQVMWGLWWTEWRCDRFLLVSTVMGCGGVWGKSKIYHVWALLLIILPGKRD